MLEKGSPWWERAAMTDGGGIGQMQSRAVCSDAAHVEQQEVENCTFGTVEVVRLCHVSVTEHTNSVLMQSETSLKSILFFLFNVSHLGTEPGEGLFFHKGRGLLELFALLSKCLVKVELSNTFVRQAARPVLK